MKRTNSVKLKKILKDPIPDENKAAVVEKWLTYCKSRFVNLRLEWRLQVLLSMLSPLQIEGLKDEIGSRQYNL